MDRLLRIEEVSEQTGIALGTLRAYRQRGTGPKSTKIGKRVVYRESDVVAWVDAQFEQSEA